MTKEELEKEAEEYADDHYLETDEAGEWLTDEEIMKRAYIAGAKAQIGKIQEKLKADLIANLKERMQYSTSPSCTKGMELFIKSIKEWEIKENG